MNKYVIIHGDKWKTEDIKKSVEWAREQNWKKQKWVARAALISQGSASDYVGQKYNPEHTELVDGGWTHDHCEICWWTLCESDNPDEGEGYTLDGRRWICKDCYEQFIKIKV